MIIPIELIVKAMNLTVPELKEAMAKEGWLDPHNEIKSVSCIGFNGKMFVYNIGYVAAMTDGPWAPGKVYVSVEQGNSKDFEILATY